MATRRPVPPPVNPAHPERVCWGCEKYCPAEALGCANGSIRTPHPAELFGEDWLEWSDAHADPGDQQTGD